MTRINILVGGPTQFWPTVLKEHPDTIPGQWLAADRGALRLLKLGLKPLAAIGDFDSLTAAEQQAVAEKIPEMQWAVADKDETDTELALHLALNQYHATQVVIYGATGGRLDHLLDNIFMLLRADFRPFVPRIQIVDQQNLLQLYLPGKHTIVQVPGMHYVGFAPVTAVEKLTLYDTKYHLWLQDFDVPIMYASNQFTKKSATFSFNSGVVAVIQSCDLKA
jgi:thiamine pyrophosphokinase